MSSLAIGCYPCSVPFDRTNPRLGPLETDLLRVLWERGSATVRELVESGVPGAYTTIMTTLDRLHSKGLLNRESDGRAFRYAPSVSRAEFERDRLRAAIERFLSGIALEYAPLSYLVDALGEKDAELLDRLEQEIERKRRELKGEGK